VRQRTTVVKPLLLTLSRSRTVCGFGLPSGVAGWQYCRSTATHASRLAPPSPGTSSTQHRSRADPDRCWADSNNTCNEDGRIWDVKKLKQLKIEYTKNKMDILFRWVCNLNANFLRNDCIVIFFFILNTMFTYLATIQKPMLNVSG